MHLQCNPFSPTQSQIWKEKLLKSKEIEKKKSEKDGDQEVDVKGWGAQKERKGFWKTRNLFDYIKLFKVN